MTPQQIMGTVTAFIDRMIDCGPMFPSIIDLEAWTPLEGVPPAIPCQREGDRSPCGSNLMHDIPLLGTMLGLAEVLDRPSYQDAVEGYCRVLSKTCTDTENGLFPWGEHAFWDISLNRPAPTALRGTARLGHDPSPHIAPVR